MNYEQEFYMMNYPLFLQYCKSNALHDFMDKDGSQCKLTPYAFCIRTISKYKEGFKNTPCVKNGELLMTIPENYKKHAKKFLK